MEKLTFEPCIIIPTYNHGARIIKTLERLAEFNLEIIVVNDGSTDNTADILKDHKKITYLELDSNYGKGKAVKEGFKIAIANKKSHAIQIDADGQHDISALAEMINLSEKNPDCLILGKPLFQKDIPKIRLYGRELTNYLFALESRSFKHLDVMCGFRIYPINNYQEVLLSSKNGNRMDFDLTIVVNLVRAGCKFIQYPVNVSYPLENTSNFKYFRDNLIMIKAHLGLLFSALTGY